MVAIARVIAAVLSLHPLWWHLLARIAAAEKRA